MIDGEIPLREIEFRAGFCVVNHRIRQYNAAKPPFLVALDLQRKEQVKSSPQKKIAKKPAFSSALQRKVREDATAVEDSETKDTEKPDSASADGARQDSVEEDDISMSDSDYEPSMR
ncbi:hypothetical protein PINS_up017497, partial [Pythium insidiosum]